MSKLEAVSITKSFGDNTILQDVSLRLEPRDVYKRQAHCKTSGWSGACSI